MNGVVTKPPLFGVSVRLVTRYFCCKAKTPWMSVVVAVVNWIGFGFIFFRNYMVSAMQGFLANFANKWCYLAFIFSNKTSLKDFNFVFMRFIFL